MNSMISKGTCPTYQEQIGGTTVARHAREKKCAPKDKRSTCNIDDEEAALLFDDRRRQATIKQDPIMIVPVLSANLGIKI